MVTVSAVSSNGFASDVTVTLSGLPAGVTASPSGGFTIHPGGQVAVSVAVANTAAAETSTVTLQGVAGMLNHSTDLPISVQAAQSVQSMGRTRYVRTDSATEYPYDLNANWVVYDSGTNRFFVSDPDENRIVVMDAGTQKQLATIPVPGAYGLDMAPDSSTLYAGTEIGDVYAINTVTMQTTHRYLASGIGAYGFSALSAHVLASGKLALLGSAGGIASVDGSNAFAIWDPVSNAIDIYTTPYGSAGQLFGGGPPETVICSPVENIGAFTLSGDRTRVVLGSIDSDGGVCSFDPVAKQAVAVTGPAFVLHLVATPDGNSIIESNQAVPQVIVRDAHTLAQTMVFPVADTDSGTTMAVSPDSKTLYVQTDSILYGYDLTTGAQVGWIPTPVVQYLSGGGVVGAIYGPNTPVFDGTGVLAGPMEEGVGFIDTTAMRTGNVGTKFLNAYLDPATGPVSGGTTTLWSFSSTGKITSVLFGGNAGQSISKASNGTAEATSPVGLPGPVDVYSFTDDGGVQIVPEAFSYGPTLLESTPDTTTAEGGGAGVVFGYGFGSADYSASTAPPSDLQLSIGGKQVPITSFVRNAYGTSSPPFLLQAITYTTPAGVAGTNADIVVTTKNGTATLAGGLHFVPAVQQFPLAGASLAQGIYDPKRDLYYFTDANVIRVFSRTSGAWMTPIQVPAAAVGSSHRLWGIALSHDGSKLAVSDAGTSSIYLIDPDAFTAKTFSVVSQSSGVIFQPAGLAISNVGNIYYTIADYGGTGYHGFFKLNTTNSQTLDYKIDNPGLAYTDLMLRAAISSDDSTVYFNADGEIFSVTTATDQITYAHSGSGCCYGEYDLTVSETNVVAASNYLLDSNLHAIASPALNDRESASVSYIYGAKFNADGTLLFQPSVSGIDVYDARFGALRSRIALPITLAPIFDALAADNKDSVLVAITGTNGNGIAVIDLSSLIEPSPLPYEKTSDGHAMAHGVAMPRMKGVAGAAAGSSIVRPARGSMRPPAVALPLDFVGAQGNVTTK